MRTFAESPGSASRVIVGTSASSIGNSVLVQNGGLLEANTLSNFFGGTGNTISNVAGTYQFTTNTPVIAPSGAGNIALSGGTISFRAITNANVQSSLGAGALSGITFAGNNTFQLNAASNTTLSSQTYTFDTSSSPSNYVNLALINGATAYRNGDFSGAHFHGTDLSGANLSGADLSGANLEAAILRGASLDLARLSEAHLKDTDFTNANWWRARGLNRASLDYLVQRFAPTDEAPADLRADFAKWRKDFATQE